MTREQLELLESESQKGPQLKEVFMLAKIGLAHIEYENKYRNIRFEKNNYDDFKAGIDPRQ